MPHKLANAGDPWSGAITALWTGAANPAFEFWVSFFPTAPMFGVEWRFAEASRQFNPFAVAGSVPKAAKAVEEAVEAGSRIAAEVTAEVAEATLTATATAASAAIEAEETVIRATAEPKTALKVAGEATEKAIKAVEAAAEEATKSAEKSVAKATAKVLKVAEQAAESASETVSDGAPASLLKRAPKDPDDLTAIKGIGPGLAAQLNGLGVYRLKQLAKFSEADLAWVDAHLTAFKGRCFRDDWAGQAKTLLKA